jgi:hypothetical protein
LGDILSQILTSSFSCGTKIIFFNELSKTNYLFLIIYMKENRENHDIKDIKQAKYDFYRRHLLVKKCYIHNLQI